MIDLEQAIVILIQWATETKAKGVTYTDFWVDEYPSCWVFSPCGPKGEILYVSRGISVSKETGETGFYFPPDHPENRGKVERIGNKPIHINLK